MTDTQSNSGGSVCFQSNIELFTATREYSRRLCETLVPEDCVLQSMPDASPTRWHLAHTTWFFETFLLKQQSGYTAFNAEFEVLFNSYYNTVGKQFAREQRGLLSRPTLQEVWQYRQEVNHRMEILLSTGAYDPLVLMTGIQHEQQHQELILTDIKHAFSINPIHPVFRQPPVETAVAAEPSQDLKQDIPKVKLQSPVEVESSDERWIRFDSEEVVEIGADGSQFCFDNELPRHRRLLPSFSICRDLVTCAQYLEFIEDGGYQRPEHWLSVGWATVTENGWFAPLYWDHQGDEWFQFTLRGRLPVDFSQPVTHLSYYEADAFARWSGRRLPTEFEWEHAVCRDDCELHLELDSQRGIESAMHPSTPPSFDGRLSTSNVEVLGSTDSLLNSVFGSVWQWTSSSYEAYPGYSAPPGAIGEYNGKFMCGQYVLRGGSCATPPGHARVSYRNFFPPHVRWQFSGIRLAK